VAGSVARARKGVTGSGITLRARLEGGIGGPVNSILVGVVGEHFIKVQWLRVGNARHVGASSDE